MTEYIEREYAVDAVVDVYYDTPDINLSCEKFEAAILEIPAADVAPVRHGRWIHERTEGGFHIWRCNQCGRGVNDNPEGVDLYCYHCGAKMDGSVSE